MAKSKKQKKKKGSQLVISGQDIKQSASELMEMVSMALRAGYSVDHVCHKFNVERDKVYSIQDEIVEIAKQNAVNQRVIFRQNVRDKMILAQKYMFDVVKGDHDFEPSKKTQLKLSAAKSLLTFGSKFIDEDALTLWVETPKDQENTEKPLDFEIVVDEQGKTSHIVKWVDDDNN